MKTLRALLIIGFFVSSAYADDRAQTQIGDFAIVATLRSSHPFLAEYKRLLKIEQKGKVILDGDLGTDPGGFAYINLLRDNHFLLFQSYSPFAYRLDTTTGKIEKIDYLTEEELGKIEFIGQFGKTSDGTFSYIPSSKMKKPRLQMIKGG